MPSHTPKESLAVPAHIQSRLEGAGLRRTLATRAVLGVFLANPQGSVTHSQVQTALETRGLDINRVTLYRLLDRLAACGVLRRHADDGARTWRFGLAGAEEAGPLARFECDACQRQFRFTEADAAARAVAAQLFRSLARLGHQGQRLELCVHGTCAACAAPAGLESIA